jgi:hypothetical protein
MYVCMYVVSDTNSCRMKHIHCVCLSVCLSVCTVLACTLMLFNTNKLHSLLVFCFRLRSFPRTTLCRYFVKNLTKFKPIICTYMGIIWAQAKNYNSKTNHLLLWCCLAGCPTCVLCHHILDRYKLFTTHCDMILARTALPEFEKLLMLLLSFSLLLLI